MTEMIELYRGLTCHRPYRIREVLNSKLTTKCMFHLVFFLNSYIIRWQTSKWPTESAKMADRATAAHRHCIVLSNLKEVLCIRVGWLWYYRVAYKSCHCRACSGSRCCAPRQHRLRAPSAPSLPTPTRCKYSLRPRTARDHCSYWYSIQISHETLLGTLWDTKTTVIFNVLMQFACA